MKLLPPRFTLGANLPRSGDPTWPRAYARHRRTGETFELGRGPINNRYLGSGIDSAIWLVWLETRATLNHGVRGFANSTFHPRYQPGTYNLPSAPGRASL
jgi:hypothetical protein